MSIEPNHELIDITDIDHKKEEGRLKDDEDENINYSYHVLLNEPQTNNYPSNYISTTKYTLWNFIPKNLYYQLQRLSNIYFILVMIFALIPGVSPIFPITSILPVVFILVTTAAKDALEDFVCVTFF